MAECKKGFLHGGDLQGAAEKSGRRPSELLDFSANINPLGMPPGVREAVLESLEQSLFYPDPFCRRLRKELAEYTGQKTEHILCGSGGADLIYRLVYALRPKKALVTAPAFAEYEEALAQTGTEIVFHELGESPVTKTFLEKLSPDLELVFLCNPNNPTGLLTEKALIRELLERSRKLGIRVLLDECFLDFVPEEKAYTASDLLEEYPNLVILKSFTKLFAIPGLRLGYALCSDTELLSRMQRAGQPWAVSEPAQAAGIAALRDIHRVQAARELVCSERGRMEEELKEAGVEVIPSKANFILMYSPYDLFSLLKDRGILIRDCSNYSGLGKGWYRTAVRRKEENDRLLEAIRQICG